MVTPFGIFIGEQPGLHPILKSRPMKVFITVPLDKYEGFNLRILPSRLINALRKQQQS